MRLPSLIAAVLSLVAFMAAGTAAPPVASPGTRPIAAAKPAVAFAGWPTYHHDNSRAGYDGSNTFNSRNSAGDWYVSNLTGNTFASPVVWNGMVYMATEESYVYALDEHTGTIVWSRQVASPTPGNGTYIGCSSTQFGPDDGITGTPVVDTATGDVYVVAMVPTAAAGYSSQFELFGLNGSTGVVVATVSLAHTNLDPKYQNQRGALAIANGRVYIPFGGRYGDCGSYHPWVIGVSLSDHSQVTYQPQDVNTMNEAGIWAPSGMAIDGSGNVYLETGNGAYGSSMPCNNTRWDHGDAVLKLSPTLGELGFFAPPDWCSLNQGDTDLGSVAPVLMPNNELFASGKSGEGWLMNTGAMPSFGAPQQQGQLTNCNTGDAVFGGFAYANGTVYVPCDGHGLNALSVNTSAGTYGDLWHSANSYTPGAPILAGGYVWDEPQGGGTVYGYAPGSNAVVFTIPLHSGAHRFTTLAADGDRLFAMLSSGVQSLQFTTPTSFTVNFITYLPWFDRISSPNFRADNIHVINPDPANTASINVIIPGQPGCVISGDSLPPRGEKYYTCATGFGGPVTIQASARVIASQRVQYGSTFNEVPAQSSPSTSLVFPWYDLLSDPGFVADNIHVVNPTSGAETVTVNIPGCSQQQQSVAAGGYAIFNCSGGYGGPVTITSTGTGVLASQRVQYYSSFNEVPALPVSAANTSVWLSWFDRISDTNFRNDNIHVVNPNGSAASVSVTIPGCGTLATVSIPAHQQTYFTCATGFGGPVHVSSNVGVLASARVQYGQTFNEVAGQATGANTLFLAWFDRVSDPGFVSDNVHIVNPGPGSASVTATIPGCGTSAPANLGAGAETYFTCANGFGGPVVVSSSGAAVVASQRVKYYQSFNEVAGQS